jgi:hypothetical protein
MAFRKARIPWLAVNTPLDRAVFQNTVHKASTC